MSRISHGYLMDIKLVFNTFLECHKCHLKGGEWVGGRGLGREVTGGWVDSAVRKNTYSQTVCSVVDRNSHSWSKPKHKLGLRYGCRLAPHVTPLVSPQAPL